MRIAIDAMGGDYAPQEIVKGALDSLHLKSDLEIVLVGRFEEIKKLLTTSPPNISIEDAPQVVAMGENPMEVLRSKRNSSIVKCINLLARKKVDAVISAGNTGATMVASVFWLGTIGKIKRPAIAIPYPTRNGFAILIDAGANINPTPARLVQFGIMAAQYYKACYEDILFPRIGLLNIGSEGTKGTRVYQRAYRLFQKVCPKNFYGNIEGHQLFDGICQVVVCDGFVGNILLKTGEGLSLFLCDMISQKCKASQEILDVSKKFKSMFNYNELGGAMLLGVNGVVVVCHGRSKAETISNSIKTTINLVSSNINDRIREEAQRVSLLSRIKMFFKKEEGEAT